MAKIVISYRRSDTDAISGRMRDRLAGHFGEQSIFMDIDDIPFGTDFRDHIRNALLHSDIVIVVVGQKWLGPGKGKRTRINEESDPVRIEVETALEHRVPVVPVLVNGAKMPTPAELPASLSAFAFRNAATVDTGRDFHTHMDRLIRALDDILQAKSPKPKAAEAPEKAPVPAPAAVAAAPAPSRRWRLALALGAGAGVGIAVAAYLALPLLRPAPTTPTANVTTTPTQTTTQTTTPTQTTTSTTPANPQKTASVPSVCSNTSASSFDANSVPPVGTQLRDAVKNGITPFFLCGAATIDRFARAFATLSVIIADYAPNGTCFAGDAVAASPDWNVHKGWADRQGRTDLMLVNLRAKVDLAFASCIAPANQPTFFAEMARAYAAASAPGDSATLVNPTIKGQRIDRCLNYATDCNETAALAVCRRFGFTKVAKWEWAYVAPTITLGDRLTCGMNCGAFTSLTCSL